MEHDELKLGSLFDGSGGFPLAGKLHGIKPVWAAEVEPFPIRVTTKRLPEMKHLGDISKIDGGMVEPVDIITFGSPCTDMSVAGKRAGLDGKQSCLFYEAIRIVKEMREKTDGRYPRFIVWENVPGAFSSNKGEDFRAVLQAVCSIQGADDAVPESPKGKWTTSGHIVGEGYDVAWRTLDAQYWGVPQRRRRIYLVADFADRCAGKILFESEGVSGYSAEGCRPWKRTADATEESIGEAGRYCLNDQGGNRMDVTEHITSTLRASSTHPPLVYENHGQDSRITGPLNTAQTLMANLGTGGNNQPFVVQTPKTLKIRSGREGGGKGALIQDNMSATLSCNNEQTVFVPKAYHINQRNEGIDLEGKSGALMASQNLQMQTFVVEDKKKMAFGICSKDSNSMKSDNPNSGFYKADIARTLDANGGNPSCNQGGIVVLEGNGVRPSHKGDGYKESEKMYTLNTVEQHAVAYGIDRSAFNQGKNAKYGICVDEELQPAMVAKGPGAVAVTYSASKASFFCLAEKEKANTLVATDYKEPPIVNSSKGAEECKAVESDYIVRRLTPVECARLQGFPDDWCADLGERIPSDAELDWWAEVFETHRQIQGKSGRPKSRKQIFKWLQNPYTDSAAYKMWGNGVALPCVSFVLAGIKYYAEKKHK